jgi:hypothetical protein
MYFSGDVFIKLQFNYRILGTYTTFFKMYICA